MEIHQCYPYIFIRCYKPICTDNQATDNNPATANPCTDNPDTESHPHHHPCTEAIPHNSKQAQQSFILTMTMTMVPHAQCVAKRPPTSPGRKWDVSHGLGSVASSGRLVSSAGSRAAWMAARTLNLCVFPATTSRIQSRQTVADRHYNDHYNFIFNLHLILPFRVFILHILFRI